MFQHFGHSRLFRDNRRYPRAHRFQRRNPERFGYRRHHVDITVGKHLLYILTTQKTCKMKFRCNPQFSHPSDRAVHHIPATCHNKTYIRITFQHFIRCLDKIFGSFLISNPSQEGHDLFFYPSLDFHFGIRLKINGIMYRHHFIRIDPIAGNDDIPG